MSGGLCKGYPKVSIPNKSYPAMRELNSLYLSKCKPKDLVLLSTLNLPEMFIEREANAEGTP